MAVDDVYVLGAGASYVHGAPLTDQLLPIVFKVIEIFMAIWTSKAVDGGRV